MSLNGKKINELEQISNVTSETVLPSVYISGNNISNTATKVSVSQLASHIKNGMVIEPTLVTDTTSTAISLSNILANTIYQYGTLTSLTINGFETSYNRSSIYFTTSENSFTSSFSGSFNWLNGVTPEFELGKSYIIHLVNGITYVEELNTQNITTIVQTSGIIHLKTNKVYKLNLNGDTEFVLPTILNNNILNQILIQLYISGTITVEWGTTYCFEDTEPVSDEGNYNIIYEFDSINQRWYIGQLAKN